MIKYPDCVNVEDKIFINNPSQRHKKVKVICPTCGKGRYAFLDGINKAIKANTFAGKCCSCSSGRLRGKKSPNWKGGKYIDLFGYVHLTIQPDNPFFCMARKSNTVLEHRLVMAEYLGRPLTKKESVHHIDSNRKHNKIENLVLMTKSNHQRFEKLFYWGKVKRKDVFRYAVKGV